MGRKAILLLLVLATIIIDFSGLKAQVSAASKYCRMNSGNLKMNSYYTLSAGIGNRIFHAFPFSDFEELNTNQLRVSHATELKSASLESTFIGNASMIIYPNPANEHIAVVANGQVIQSLKIVNIIGQVVMSSEPKILKADIDLRELEQGAYFVQIMVNNKIMTKRLEIVR